MSDGGYTLKQHEDFLRTLISLSGGKTEFLCPVKKIASVYGFTKILRDEEELEFVLDDLFMTLADSTLIRADGSEISSCGILSSDYDGEGKDVSFCVDPDLLKVKDFSLIVPEEDDEEDDYTDEF